MPTRRQRRVAQQLHRELSLLIMLEVRDPRLTGVTITGVDVTPDLLQAHVYYAVLGSEEDRAEAIAGLEHAKGFLRKQVAERIRLRFAPELSFRFDRSSEYGQRIDQLLDRLGERDRLTSEPRSD